jgi:K+-sensing histidine kinase KdpD
LTNYSIEVQDYGAGIPQDQLDKLFSDFGTLEVHRKQNPEGRGLGLAISKIIVENMEGSIKVQSRLGHGTTFTVSFVALCCATKADEPEPDIMSARLGSQQSAGQLSNNRIVSVASIQ